VKFVHVLTKNYLTNYLCIRIIISTFARKTKLEMLDELGRKVAELQRAIENNKNILTSARRTSEVITS